MLINVLHDKKFKMEVLSCKLYIQRIETLKYNFFNIKFINYFFFLILNKCLKNTCYQDPLFIFIAYTFNFSNSIILQSNELFQSYRMVTRGIDFFHSEIRESLLWSQTQIKKIWTRSHKMEEIKRE